MIILITITLIIVFAAGTLYGETKQGKRNIKTLRFLNDKIRNYEYSNEQEEFDREQYLADKTKYGDIRI